MHDSDSDWHYVAPSALHGKGAFARRFIPKETHIMEYQGERITAEEADEQPSADPDNPYRTFFFALSDGTIIDGGQGGNEARWINHSCEPNCEGYENEAGDKVYIVAKRDIQPHEELLYDYALTIDEPLTDSLKENYACWCGAPSCRGTMLSLEQESATDAEAESGAGFESGTAVDEASNDFDAGPFLPVILRRLRPHIRREVRTQLQRQRQGHRRRQQRRRQLLKSRFDKTS